LKATDDIIYLDALPLSNRLARLAWNWVWLLLFRPTPSLLFGWRRFLLRLFGARIGKGVHVYPSVSVWAPWNLQMEDRSALGPGVNCYSVGPIFVGANATVSQNAHLCSAGHDIADIRFRLTIRPIRIGSNAWVAADAFVGPGVSIGEGAVVGARAAVFKEVKPWMVVGGNPAKVLKKRELRPEKRRK
jgi:putative colanic acid biosynthesis acetyltransferase WcaF